jgi:hypothetical protein
MPAALRAVVSGLALTALLAAPRPAAAQPPPAAPPTAVLVNLTIKPDADRSKLPGVMPGEVRDTVKLYLDGKIQQWWGRGDGRGVMFILNVTTAADAKALMESLPLGKSGLATFDYTVLTPLNPLRLLIAEPAAAPKGDRDR